MADTTFYPFEATWETGDMSEWDSEVDSQNKFETLWYKYVVERWGMYRRTLPYRGSYVAHLDLSLGTADAYVQSASIAAGAGTTVWVRFYLQVTSNLVMAASDYFTILTLQSGTPLDQAVIGLVNNAGSIELVTAATSALAAGLGANTRHVPFSRDIWHLVELGVTVDSGGNDGTIQLWLDGYPQGSAITGLTQAAVTQARLGAIGIDAGTTAGHLFFDQFVVYTSQIGGFRTRYTQVIYLTKSGFVAQGPGKIEEYSMFQQGSNDCHMRVYDADRHPILAGADLLGPELANPAPYEPKVFAYSKRDGYFNRGLYIQLTGTQPRATITLGAYQASEALIRDYALRRSPSSVYYSP